MFNFLVSTDCIVYSPNWKVELQPQANQGEANQQNLNIFNIPDFLPAWLAGIIS